MVRIPDRLVDRLAIVFNEPPIVAEIVGQIVVDLGGVILERRLHVDDRRQLFDVGHDRFGSILRLGVGFCHDRGDRIANMTDLALCEHRMRRLLHRIAFAVGHLPAAGKAADAFEVLAGKDAQDARHRLGGGGVHPVDPSVGHVGAHEDHIGLSAQIDVVGIAAPTRQEPHVLAPLGAGAYATVFGHVFPP